ncbi:MAG: pilus assembly protein [Candidatus Dormibacteraeota bacterium]|nr:pilus assembly protein [Candidatus Dormibacteraeota bacterium]
MIEFALALPILALLLVGSLTLGRAAYDATVVQEAVDEAAKASAIDRLSADKNNAYQMNEPKLLEWIRTQANTMDPSIDANNTIVCSPTPGGLEGNWGYNQGEMPKGMPAGGGIYGDAQSFLGGKVGGAIAKVLNPGLETMRVTYNYKTSIGPALTYPITYNIYFSKYQMTWTPRIGGGTAIPC